MKTPPQSSGSKAPPSIESLQWKARAELELRARQMAGLPLQDFVPRLSPGFMRPYHLAPLTEAFQRAVRRARNPEDGDPVRVACSVAPRHLKTETLLHAIAWALRRRPELVCGFISYGSALAESKSDRARMLSKRASVQMSTTMQKRSEWRTNKGGGLLATGITGALTGQGLDIAIVDDPFKNRIEAESPVYREKVYENIHDVVVSRLEPGGSVFIVQARWHPDDAVGRFVQEGYQHINFPAIADVDDPITGRKAGEALLPERYPVGCELFRDQQRVPYTWESLYQGRPRPRGARVFIDVHLYDPAKDPQAGFVVGIGVDFAYSVKTRSDWSVAVVLARRDDTYFILDIIRVQEKSDAFEDRLKKLSALWPTARIHFKGSAIECEIAERMKKTVKRLEYETAHGDKLVRSEDAQRLWNGGKLLVPDDVEETLDSGIIAPKYSLRHLWVPQAVEEVCGFTGVKDRHDDVVDALSNAVEAVGKTKIVTGFDMQNLAAGLVRPRE